MTLLEYLREILITDPDVAALVSTRVYASNPAQNAKDPYIVLAQVYADAEDSIDCGMLNWQTATIQMEAYSFKQGTSYNVWKVAREALHPFQRGYTTDLAIKGIVQSSGVSVDALDPIDASDVHLYRTRQDFDITYTYQ